MRGKLKLSVCYKMNIHISSHPPPWKNSSLLITQFNHSTFASFLLFIIPQPRCLLSFLRVWQSDFTMINDGARGSGWWGDGGVVVQVKNNSQRFINASPPFLLITEAEENLQGKENKRGSAISLWNN